MSRGVPGKFRTLQSAEHGSGAASEISRGARPVLIMAGGTGGHVFPALALARLLRAQSLEVVWLGTERGLESRVIPAEGIPIEHLSVAGLRGRGALSWIAAPFRLTRALWQALAIMRRYRPLVVVGLGGFVTGPAAIDDKRKETAIVEQRRRRDLSGNGRFIR